VHFENYLVKSVITNFEDMASKSIEQITKNHMILAELLANFSDIKKLCWKPTVVIEV
jgi:hypothetical protein